MRKLSVSGRGWAYVGAILGGTVSIAANVAHSYVPPTGAAADWSPQVGAVAGAIFWPIALFVVTEMLARVAWPDGWRWIVARFAGLLPVALVAAFVSYRHLSGLLAFYGEDRLTTMFGPLAVDGLMVMATAALLATGGRVHSAPAVVETVTEAVPMAASTPVVEPAALVTPDPIPAVTKPAKKRVTPRPVSAEKVAKVAAKMPGATVAEIAAKADVSVSTARRHLRAVRVTDASPTGPVTAETPALAAA
ncbi:DUF2637 domain-containing protein [Actinoplanes sp. CA-252034]|uniref:DUF2637 domain-containing protein n=1 Tax=Actinoplanes sp. CA-252034 TaxID=3239906 RepID=UPI003D98ADAA